MSGINQESFFRDLFEQTTDLIHILNMAGQIITVNPSWLFHLGYKLEEVKLHPIYDFIKPEYHELYRNNRKAATQNYEAKEIEFEMTAKDGRSVPVKGHVRVLDNTVQSPYTRAVLKNITSQKVIEREREQARIRLSKFFRHAPDAVIVIDQKQIVVEWNLKAELIFGYTYEEAFGKPLSDLIIPNRYCEAHLQGINRFISSGWSSFKQDHRNKRSP